MCAARSGSVKLDLFAGVGLGEIAFLMGYMFTVGFDV